MKLMRLFTALLPDEQTIETLVSIQEDMKKKGIRGRYTDPSNLHLTLAFIGEYGNTDQIMDLLETIPFEPFSLKLSSVMKFHDLFVCAFEENKDLEAYVKRLHKAFSDHGIPFDRKSFFAHITLVRKAVDEYGLHSGTDIPETEFYCEEVSLMLSTASDQGVVYTELDSVAAWEAAAE